LKMFEWWKWMILGWRRKGMGMGMIFETFELFRDQQFFEILECLIFEVMKCNEMWWNVIFCILWVLNKFEEVWRKLNKFEQNRGK
jgi:hypothetical protein